MLLQCYAHATHQLATPATAMLLLLPLLLQGCSVD
jgi:hypothetical protein